MYIYLFIATFRRIRIHYKIELFIALVLFYFKVNYTISKIIRDILRYQKFFKIELHEIEYMQLCFKLLCKHYS